MIYSLVRYDEISEDEYMDYITEWESNNEAIVPHASRREGLEFSNLVARWKYDESDAVYGKGFVPSTLFFYINDIRRIIGALHFRHELNDHLLKHGGHIGYGIRKSERNKGYAQKMLKSFLQNELSKKYEKYLLTCDDSNIGSYKVIEKCNGVLENKVEDNGKATRRYWIILK